ncbi:MAG TPA: chemotaxis protein CheC [Candidatus Methanoperedens sp.]
MSEINNLTDFQYDALKEVGNIGIGQATTSLSKMIMNKLVMITLPELRMIPLIKLPTFIKDEKPVVAIIQQLRGDESGLLLLFLSKDSAKRLIKEILGTATEGDDFDEMEMSVLKELGNIMNGTYITSLSNFLGIAMSLSTPVSVYDMLNSIINQVVGNMSLAVEDVMYLKTEFTVNVEKLDGNIIVFVDSESIKRMLNAINRLVGK